MAAKFITPAREFDLSVAQMNTLIAVVNYANGTTGLAWPSVRRMMWDTGMGKNTIIRALARLVELEIHDQGEGADKDVPRRLQVQFFIPCTAEEVL